MFLILESVYRPVYRADSAKGIFPDALQPLACELVAWIESAGSRALAPGQPRPPAQSVFAGLLRQAYAASRH